MERQGSGREE
ncbi:hypothetical protein E2C01_085984 [Portunus trituberculatus]|uniref:Uncharacterized protein n=1 Tax=Portunus trituberculatus TaxID=210409 RepID=A0A5B7JC83_PORTR|nr:hypothetical protein [Portunus trituberculatus]